LEIRAERREQVSGRSLGGVVVDRWPDPLVAPR